MQNRLRRSALRFGTSFHKRSVITGAQDLAKLWLHDWGQVGLPMNPIEVLCVLAVSGKKLLKHPHGASDIWKQRAAACMGQAELALTPDDLTATMQKLARMDKVDARMLVEHVMLLTGAGPRAPEGVLAYTHEATEADEGNSLSTLEDPTASEVGDGISC